MIFPWTCPGGWKIEEQFASAPRGVDLRFLWTCPGRSKMVRGASTSSGGGVDLTFQRASHGGVIIMESRVGILGLQCFNRAHSWFLKSVRHSGQGTLAAPRPRGLQCFTRAHSWFLKSVRHSGLGPPSLQHSSLAAPRPRGLQCFNKAHRCFLKPVKHSGLGPPSLEDSTLAAPRPPGLEDCSLPAPRLEG